MSIKYRKNRDVDHLDLLSAFHYVLAAITVNWGLFPIVISLLGPPHEIGCWASISMVLWILATLYAMAGRWLARHRYWVFCFVIAVIECAQFPMGTILGVLTALVLTRPNVRMLFGGVTNRDPQMNEIDDGEGLPEATPPSGSNDTSIHKGNPIS